MRFFLLLTLAVAALTVQAQKHFIGIKGGANFSNISARDILDSDAMTGFHGGISYERFLKGPVSIGLDLLYNERGFENDVVFQDQWGTVIGQGKMESHFNYLSLPLAVAYQSGSRIYGFARIGLIPSWLVKAETIGSLAGPNGDDETVDMTDSGKRFDLAGLIEAGGGYEIQETYRVFISVGYQHSFTSYMASDASFESRHRVLSLSLGLKYKLKG